MTTPNLGKPLSPFKARFLKALWRRCGVTEDGHTTIPPMISSNEVMLAAFEAGEEEQAVPAQFAMSFEIKEAQ